MKQITYRSVLDRLRIRATACPWKRRHCRKTAFPMDQGRLFSRDWWYTVLRECKSARGW